MFKTIIALSFNALVASRKIAPEGPRSPDPSHRIRHRDGVDSSWPTDRHMTIFPTRTITKCKPMYCSEWSDAEWCFCYNDKYNNDYIKYGCKDDGEALMC